MSPPDRHSQWLALGALLLLAALVWQIWTVRQASRALDDQSGWRHLITRKLERIEQEVSDPRPAMWGCLNPYDPANGLSCQTPVPTPTKGLP